MNTSKRATTYRTLATRLLLCGTLAGCAGDDPDGSESVCPSCDPQLGGETGDFGGSSVGGVCGSVVRRVLIDAEKATAAGFDMPEIERRLAREIDLPLRWTPWPYSHEGGGDATGYEADTRVKARMTIVEYGHQRPDPEFCDGTVCRLDDQQVPQATCLDMLDLVVRVEFETLDGAVRGTAVGQAAQFNTRFLPEFPRPAPPADRIISHSYVNLHAVTGLLRFSPDRDGKNYRGNMVFQIELFEDRVEGALLPEITFESPTRTLRYSPVVGFFPPREQVGSARSDAGAQKLASPRAVE